MSGLASEVEACGAPIEKETAKGLNGMVAAMQSRPGDPDSDDDRFLNCWMDVGRAQEALSFQHHRWPGMLEEMRARGRWKRYPTRLAAPLARNMAKRHAGYRHWPGEYANPWAALRMRYGEPGADTASL